MPPYYPNGGMKQFSYGNGVVHRFDFGNRLREAVSQEDYYHEAHERRVQANKPGTQGVVSYYSQAGQLLYQQDYRQAVRSEYVYLGGSLVAVRETPHGTGTLVVKYQHTDAPGTPVAMTDAAKGVLQGASTSPAGVWSTGR